jgi:transmembrane sensor
MNRFENYLVEDFVLDAEFQNWVRYGPATKVAFWEDYQVRFPEQGKDIQKARTLLEGVYRSLGAPIDEDEIEYEISELINRIRAAKEQENAKAFRPGHRNFARRPLLNWLVAAAVLIVGAFLSWHIYDSATLSPFEKQVVGKSLVEKTNKTALKQTVQLEDGSVVILEPKSRLSLPVHFLADKREVYLSGEAYFKVAKDIKRPFLVYSNKLVTRVLGTSFIVKAAPDAKENIVEVREGKVSVFRKDDYESITSKIQHTSKGIVLTPNQKIVFEEDLGMTKSLSDSPGILPNNKVAVRFDYTNTPVNQILQDLRDAYQVDIIYDADLLSDCPLTATLSNLPLLKKLNIICEAIEAKYEVLDGRIIIYGKSCL